MPDEHCFRIDVDQAKHQMTIENESQRRPATGFRIDIMKNVVAERRRRYQSRRQERENLTKYSESSPNESLFSSPVDVDRHISCREEVIENTGDRVAFYQRICNDGLWAKTFCVFFVDVIRPATVYYDELTEQ